MNKKGFTLIELLAVIVILAVLALVASTNVFNILDNARRGSFRTEFLSLLEAAQTAASVDLMNGEFDHSGDKEYMCYKLMENGGGALNNYFDNKNKYTGSVLVHYTNNGEFEMIGWLTGNYFSILKQTEPATTFKYDLKDVEGADRNLKNDSDTIKKVSSDDTTKASACASVLGYTGKTK